MARTCYLLFHEKSRTRAIFMLQGRDIQLFERQLHACYTEAYLKMSRFQVPHQKQFGELLSHPINILS